MSKKSKAEKRRQVYKSLSNRMNPNRELDIPVELRLDEKSPGIFFGYPTDELHSQYVGMPQGSDGNVLIIGGSGSGKSSGIIKPTLRTWNGAICATDIKGELSTYYAELSRQAAQNGVEMRPYIIFDPMQSDGLGYDPFGCLAQDFAENSHHIQDIVSIIIPGHADDSNTSYWIESERSVLQAALLYYSRQELGFIDSILALLSKNVSDFSQEVNKYGLSTEKDLLGACNMYSETWASIERGLRNRLSSFVTSPHILQAFRGKRSGARCFYWNDLERANIFLRIPQDKLDHWGCAINLMYAQLIRYLMCRPEMYSSKGRNNVQTLLLMDEFPQFGKLELIKNATSTLRSKNVNICLAVQSLAQLDELYGENGRRTILDNCQYQAILRANDVETQNALCSLIGTTEVLHESATQSLDPSGHITGYSIQRTIVREPKLFPHQLATLNDVVLISPYGSSLVKKHLPYNQWT